MSEEQKSKISKSMKGKTFQGNQYVDKFKMPL